MNQNFFVVSNEDDIKKETPRPPTGGSGYPTPGGTGTSVAGPLPGSSLIQDQKKPGPLVGSSLVEQKPSKQPGPLAGSSLVEQKPGKQPGPLANSVLVSESPNTYP